MMFGRQLDVHVVNEPHQETFKHGNRDWKFVPTQLMFRNKVNSQEKTPEQLKARVQGLLQKEKERRDRLKELGIEYDFPGFSAIVTQTKPKKEAQKPAVVPVVAKEEKKKATKTKEPEVVISKKDDKTKA